MSKDNRDMSIEEKFNYFCLHEEHELPVIKVNSTDWNFYLFKKGYELAKKEMQEKLDEAIEVIRFYADEKSWFSLIGPISNNSSKIAISEDSENIKNEATWSTYLLGGKRARDFLKARGE